jgi:hypothetical protein
VIRTACGRALTAGLALFASQLGGQVPHGRELGLGAGIAGQSDTRSGYLSPIGPDIAGQFAWRFTPRFAARASLGAARFERTAPSGDFAPCPPPPQTFSCTDRAVGPFTVATAAATLLVFDDDAARTGWGAYYVFSGVTSRPLQHPDAARPLRFGWGAGIGNRFRIGQHAATIEGQYQRVRGFTTQHFVFVPITFTYIWYLTPH